MSDRNRLEEIRQRIDDLPDGFVLGVDGSYFDTRQLAANMWGEAEEVGDGGPLDPNDPTMLAFRDHAVEDMRWLLSELATLRKDAALGRAVRNSGITLDWLTERGRELRNSRGSLALSSGAYADAHAQEIALVDAIASALREEGR